MCSKLSKKDLTKCHNLRWSYYDNDWFCGSTHVCYKSCCGSPDGKHIVLHGVGCTHTELLPIVQLTFDFDDVL